MIDASRRDRAPFLGHPPGLVVVILTGMWEVFALFGMRTVLVFYLVNDLRMSDGAAIEVAALSTAAAFALPVFGAVAADAFIGVRRAVAIGAAMMALGHLLLVLPSALYPALGLVALGNGLFKPALVAQIGRLYEAEDPRRDRAFILFKAGCNAGAILSPILCGIVGTQFGWRYALGLCGAGMSIATLIFLAGARYLEDKMAPERSPANRQGPARSGAASLSLLLVMLSAVLFWAVHGQQGGTIALWSERAVDRNLALDGLAMVIPASWFQSVNPIAIVALAPILVRFWARQDARDGRDRELSRLAVGALLLMSSLLVIAFAAEAAGAALVSPLWLVLALVLLAAGELHFDAVGQAFVVRRAPSSAITTFVSFWFLLQAAGFAVGGMLGDVSTVLGPGRFFLVTAMLAAGSAGLVVLAGLGRPAVGGDR